MAGDSEEMELAPQDLDLVSHLPPELFLKVTEYLSVPDCLRCNRVCRYWNDFFTLAEMSPFWRRASRYAGLPDYYVKYNSTNPKKLFNQIRLHRESIRTLSPTIDGAVGKYPLESTTKCEYAGQGLFVKSIDYSSIDKKEIIIAEICPEEKNIIKRDSFTGEFGQVTWTAIVANNVVWQTQDSHWYRYDIDKRTFHKMFTVALSRSMGDTIGYCRHCFFFLLAGTENTMHGYSWLFKFIKMEDPTGATRPIQQSAKTPIPPGITQFIPRPVKAHLIPDDDDCSSHQLIIQGGTGGCVFRVTHEGGEIKLTPKPIGTLNPFYDAEAAVMVVNTTSEMTLSHDEQLIGMVTSVVYPYASGLCLHVFDVKTYHRISSVRVDWKDNFNDAEVLSLSRLYTVLGVGHSKGVVKVVDSCSGRILMTQAGLSRGLPPVIPMARLLFIHYQGVYYEEALVDVQSPFSLVILFRKGVGNMESMYFHPFPEKPYTGTGIYVEEESEDDRDD
jgi:hypothetical protein